MSLNVRYEHRFSQDVSFLQGVANIQCLPHLHHELEMICLLEGSVVAYADSVRCEIHAGDIFLSFPNQIHYYEGDPFERHVGFIFKPDLIPEMMETFTMGLPQSPVIRGAANDPRVRTLIDSLFGTYDREDYPHISELRRGYLLALCAELLPRMTIVKLPVGDSESLRAIVSFCSRNYAENLSLSLLEEKLHLNKFYISHLLSGKLGLHFNDYVNSLRVSEACRYLSNSDYSITEIGSRVGFNTPRTFNRAFIKQMGVSPTEYRKMRQSGKQSGGYVPNPLAASEAYGDTEYCDSDGSADLDFGCTDPDNGGSVIDGCSEICGCSAIDGDFEIDFYSGF
ncbi:MAG: AraC family transcriptional regulator [Clostridia bacterium]|nr:AraC family transcriptional regulator [Clostridia bacterium]